MPVIAGNYNPAVGVVMEVGIAQPLQSPAGEPKSAAPQIKSYAALVDTGATSTCVSAKVVREMKLEQRGTLKVIGATATTSMERYVFDVCLPGGVEQLPTGTRRISVGMVETVSGTLFNSQAPHGTVGYDVLLGRDIICRGALQVSPDGHYAFSY